jgi:hypothetical protein
MAQQFGRGFTSEPEKYLFAAAMIGAIATPAL